MMKNKGIIILTIISIISIVAVIGTTTPKEIVLTRESNIYAKPANKAFDDDNFYKCVVDEFNNTNNKKVSYKKSLTDKQMKSIKSLQCFNDNIKSVKGIQKLEKLKDFDLNSDQLTSLDVSKNSKLEELDVSGNNLMRIDVSNNKKLETLKVDGHHFDGGQLANLDLSQNINLKYLNISFTSISDLDVSHCPKLKSLFVHHNKFLTRLNISNNNELESINVSANRLISLDVLNKPKLVVLEASSNELTSLDVSKNLKLEELDVPYNNLMRIDVSKNLNLEKLNVSHNNLMIIDVSNNKELKDFGLFSNQLTSLDVSKNTKLTVLNAGSNQLTSLDVSNNIKLEKLSISNNDFKIIDVSNNTKLKTLIASENSLDNLDVSKNSKLVWLEARKNNLTSLDVSNSSSLETLRVSSNLLDNLNISKNTKLKELDAYVAKNIGVYKSNNKYSIDSTDWKPEELTSAFEINNNKLLVDVSKIGIYKITGKKYLKNNIKYNLTFNFYVIEATSNNKNIKIDDEKDKITITGNYDEKAILSNIKLNYGTKEIKNNKFIIKYNNKVVKEFKLVYKVNSVSLDQTSVDLKKKQTVKLNAIINPSNATNKKIIWTSDNNLVATVSDNGLVTANNAGAAVITVTTDDGNKTAKAIINVERPDIVDDGIPKLNIYTYNSESKSNDQYAPINPRLIEYKIYNTAEDCQNDVNGVVVDSNVDRSSWNVYVGENKAEFDNNSLYIEAKIGGAPVGTTFHIRQTKVDGYKENNECKSFKLGETKSVTFTNNPSNSNNHYNIKIDNSMIKKGTIGIKTKLYNTDKITVIDDYQNIKIDEYTFLGWLIQRKSDNKYICYSDERKVRTKWLSDNDCIHGKIELQNNSNLSAYLSNIKNNETIILKSDWKVPSTIKIELKDTDKKEYKRYAMVLLYNDKNQCDIDVKRNIYQPAKAATSLDKGQLGWIEKQVQNSNKSSNNGKLTISKQLINKDYYMLVLGSDYYKKLSNNCIKVKANETKAVTLAPKSFKIKFDLKGGKGTVKTNAKNNTKTVDKDIKISVSEMKKSKHKFNYWIAQRKVNNRIEYRCYNFQNKKGWYLGSECMQYIKYGSGGKNYNVSINTPGEAITFIAQWKNKKTV